MKRPEKFAEAHPILWRVVHTWLGFGDLVAASQAAENPNRFGTNEFTVPDPLGPTQIAPYSPKRREIALVVSDFSQPIVILTAQTAKVSDGFTVKPGKFALKCKGAIWATTLSGTASVAVIERFNGKVA